MNRVEDFKLKTFKLFFEGLAFISIVTFEVLPLWLLAIAFIIFDYVTKVRNLKQLGEPYERNGYLRSIDKAWMFLIGLVAAGLLQAAFFPSIAITRYVAAYICIRELESIFKNIGLTSAFYAITDKLGLKELFKPKKDEDRGK